MGKRSYSIRGPVQKTHQGRTEYDLAGWGGGGAASDPQMVEEHRACNTQPWFVGNQTKTHSFTKAPTCFPILPRLVSPNFIQVQRSLFTHSGRGLLSRLSGEWQGQTGDNFRHFSLFLLPERHIPSPTVINQGTWEESKSLKIFYSSPNICCCCKLRPIFGIIL